MTETNSRQPEPEHQGPIWKHPYFLYVILTVGIFAFLLIMGWVFLSNDLLPDRGIHR